MPRARARARSRFVACLADGESANANFLRRHQINGARGLDVWRLRSQASALVCIHAVVRLSARTRARVAWRQSTFSIESERALVVAHHRRYSRRSLALVAAATHMHFNTRAF